MKKFLKLSAILIILKGNFLFASDRLYQNYLNLINEDIKTLNKIFIEDILKVNNTVTDLNLAVDMIKNLDNQVNAITNNLNDAISSNEINKMLDLVIVLSNQSVDLAKLIVTLSNNQVNSANESYKHTLDELIYATLRLSDDIGVMADRILLMAEQIGIMADRILETQRIQSENYNNTINLLTSLK